jgi:Myb/SANT-like DNA-binding domain
MPPRATRNRRPPNREPTSLAAATSTSENEAIDTIEIVAPDANIDPAITTYEIDHPPPPSQLVDSLDPNYDIYPLNDFEYPPPSPILPNESQGREVSWPPTPPLPFAPLQSQPASPIPLPFTSDTQPQLPLRWTFKMEEILFHTLLEQVDIGKRADSGFKKEAWTACSDAIRNTTGQFVSIEKCKNKVEAMKALWRDLNWLKDQSGFGWDENIGLVQAGDQAWKDVIKVSNTINNSFVY